MVTGLDTNTIGGFTISRLGFGHFSSPEYSHMYARFQINGETISLYVIYPNSILV